ncbi:MAG TPA: uracil-DNA glycosylase [Persephonella sp.]|nr:uracil-DNA glycosylase [Hydrogenothermaceae bacterium]HIQ25529.1 uracil-DNA glycosylase [Persephonella sp.]
MSEKKVNCFKCKYFYITWDKKFPYGCKAFGFKSRLLPSIEVYKASKKKCLYFTKKD